MGFDTERKKIGQVIFVCVVCMILTALFGAEFWIKS